MLKFILFSSLIKSSKTKLAHRFFNITKSFRLLENESKILHSKVNDNLTRNLLIFSKESNDGMLKSFYGLGFFAIMSFWGISNLQLSSDVQKKITTPNVDSFMGSFQSFITSGAFIYVTSALLILIGASVTGFFLFSNLREVNKLYLLKGSNKLGIITDGIFAREHTYKVNLADVSFKKLRKEDPRMLKFKVKDKLGYFNLNLTEGNICEEELFDFIICSQRF